jgi:superoxide dismutase, Fe-Mn family
MALTLPPLPYPYDALQPHMSRETLEYHHDKHHKAYVDTANNLLKDSPLADKPLEVIVKESYGKNAPLFNNAAQAWNHTHFWNWLKPHGGGKIPGKLEKGLTDSFGSIDEAKKQFIQAGVTQFGSGWAWFVVKNGKIEILKTPNGENPIIHDSIAILGVDVWEHSYYIDYRNRRADYLQAFIDNLVNWDYVAELYHKVVG